MDYPRKHSVEMSEIQHFFCRRKRPLAFLGLQPILNLQNQGLRFDMRKKLKAKAVSEKVIEFSFVAHVFSNVTKDILDFNLLLTCET